MALAIAPAAQATGYSWPLSYTFSDGTAAGMTLRYQYDINDYSGDKGKLEDDSGARREYLGVYIRKPDWFEATVAYNFTTHSWLDIKIRWLTSPLLPLDLGALEVAGYAKVPAGLEGFTSTAATSFMELALPVQAIYPGRRVGIDWAFTREHYVVNAGLYRGRNVDGTNVGHMSLLRAVWIPLNESRDVLHVGATLSRETLGGEDSADSIVRIRARPEAGLTSIRLVDSGELTSVASVWGAGLEGLWIHGPFSVQSEYLAASVLRGNGFATYRASGYYAYGSWVLTGESRGYKSGSVSDVRPTGPFGAVELLLRYSELDLGSGPVQGGQQHNWTLGANWYLTRNFKLQANYVKVQSERQGVHTNPNIVEMRFQMDY